MSRGGGLWGRRGRGWSGGDRGPYSIGGLRYSRSSSERADAAPIPPRSDAGEGARRSRVGDCVGRSPSPDVRDPGQGRGDEAEWNGLADRDRRPRLRGYDFPLSRPGAPREGSSGRPGPRASAVAPRADAATSKFGTRGNAVSAFTALARRRLVSGSADLSLRYKDPHMNNPSPIPTPRASGLHFLNFPQHPRSPLS